MATTAAIFSSLRRRRSPSPEAFLAPVDLTGVALVETLAAISAELISSYAHNSFPFQRKNSRSLVRKIEILAVLLEFLETSTAPQQRLPSAAAGLCFQELYLILYRSKMLLDYCAQSSRLWLLLQNHPISAHFLDLARDISTLLDVFPLKELDLDFAGDIREQVELLQRQSRRAKLVVDEGDEALRLQGFAFLNTLEKGQIPNPTELRSFFVEGLGVRDARDLRSEIEFLEEEIRNQDGDLEPPASVLYGIIALARYYSTFLFFRFDETTVVDQKDGRFSEQEQEQSRPETKNVRGLIMKEIADTFVTIPGDFICPISLDLMRDPVIVCTGQTYDRSSISRWFDQGCRTCPKTGQLLVHTNVVPNRALRNLIRQWSIAHAAITVFDPSESPVVASLPSPSPSDAFAAAAAAAANRATVALLIEQLASGSQSARAAAASEIRLLAKTGKEHRAHIAEAGAIPHLKSLLWSRDKATQENAVTAMLNLSIHDGNRRLIMEEEGCLESIVEVLRSGIAAAAMENAAATLFSLSAVHGYKERIVDQEGAVEALAGMLKWGTPRGKKDAVGALFNLSTHPANCGRMVDAGALKALVGALATEEAAEVAARALTLMVRQPEGAEAVGDEEAAAGAVVGLIGMMRCGTPRGKESAVAALLELCRSGGDAATERVVTTTPALEGLLQSLLFTGTKRARRKVASLARVFQRCEKAAGALHFWRLGVGYSIAANTATRNRDPTLGVDVSVPTMPITVPAL